jgi:hypothetical protein
MIPRLFTIAITLAVFYGAALLVVFLVMMQARRAAMAKQQAIDRVVPEIASAVVDFASGNNDPSRVRAFLKGHRDPLENCLLQYHATLSGEGRNRLGELALDLGLVQRWCSDAVARSPHRRQRALSRLAMVATHEPSRRLSEEILHNALKDRDELARLEAARTLIHSGDEDDVAKIFHLAIEHSLIVRIMLADELRKHLLPLCQSVIPQVLRSNDTPKIAACLELLAAWERAVPLAEVAQLARYSDRQVRLRALRVLPLAPGGPESTMAVERALIEDDEEICVAAANAAGRMRLEGVLGPLARCLRSGKVDLSRAAASALAALPPRGWETLSELSDYADSVTASAALEALERARKAPDGI